MSTKTLRGTLLASLLLLATAAPAMAQGLVEYALILVMVTNETGGTVVRSIEAPGALGRDCVFDAEVAPLCEELAALEGAPSSVVMAELHRFGWRMESAVDAASGVGDGDFSSGDLIVVLGSGRRSEGGRAGWADGDWNGDGDFGTIDDVIPSNGIGDLRTRTAKPMTALTALGTNLESAFDDRRKQTGASSRRSGRNPTTGAPVPILPRRLAVDVVQSRLEAGEIDLVEGLRFAGGEAGGQVLFVYSIGVEP